jgi:hypothetical protein
MSECGVVQGGTYFTHLRIFFLHFISSQHMTKELTKVDTITLKYFMNTQYAVDTGESDDSTDTSSVPKEYKERIVRLFTDMINETPTAETTDKLETIFRAFVTESVSMYRVIDAMPQRRAIDTIDTQDIAIHELDKDLVKKIGTSGKRVMEEFVQYERVSKLPEPPRVDKISSYGRDTERNGEVGETHVDKKKKVIKKKKRVKTDEPQNHARRENGQKEKK